MPPPTEPKIYHIVHVDRLASIVTDGALWSEAVLQRRARSGTTIGMGTIKQRRLTTPVKCRPGLNVGDCVPFYFCPRSVMLYMIHMANRSRTRLSRRPGTYRASGSRPARGGGLGGTARSSMGLHPFQRGLALFQGPLRTRAIGRNRLGCRSSTGLAGPLPRKASGVPSRAFLSLGSGPACRRTFPARSGAGARSHAGERTPARHRDQARVVLLMQGDGHR